MRSITTLTLFCLFFTPVLLFSQKNKIKFGDIKVDDFVAKVYPLDTSANGIVLSDIGSSVYEVDNNGGFNIIFKRHTRMRLLNRNAFDEATISLLLYNSGTLKEKIFKIEASTFNLENGQVIETKLDRHSIFEEKLNSHYVVNKFTMPNLKEGCIVDIKYTLISPYERDLRTWYFQDNLPVVYSEYECSVPAIYDFVILKQGIHAGQPRTTKTIPSNFNLRADGGSGRTEYYSLKTDVVQSRWVMENIPRIKAESFSNTLKNRVDKIEFQLSAIRYPNSPVQFVMNNWQVAAEQLLKRENFGLDLNRYSAWYANELEKIVGSKDLNLVAAKKIYCQVRDNFTCKDHEALFTQADLKKVYQSKSGNVAEINLLLTALLKNQGFVANPVVLSTRPNGKAYEIYPVLDKFNYVICEVYIDGKQYLLDASYARLGFGKLRQEAYNGFARVIDINPILVNLSADSLREEKSTIVLLFNDDKNGLEGDISMNLSYNESFELRELISQKPTEEYFKTVKASFPSEFKVSAPSLDSLKNLEEPVTVRCKVAFETNGEDIIYFNPLLYGSIKENPFKAGERLYPIEMESAVFKMYHLQMDVPKGYKVDELPKSVRVKFNDNEGMFEYLVQNDNGVIHFSCLLKLDRATFDPEDYESLRDFFGFIVNKESEQIVFKKL